MCAKLGLSFGVVGTYHLSAFIDQALELATFGARVETGRDQAEETGAQDRRLDAAGDLEGFGF